MASAAVIFPSRQNAKTDPIGIHSHSPIWVHPILKRERYYGRQFDSREELVAMIETYIEYYNNRRVQRNLGVQTPTEKHSYYLLAA